MTKAKKTKFLRAEDIDTGVMEIAKLANAQGVTIALAGGAAMQLYGSDRLTKDVDFLANRVLKGVTTKGPLTFGGVQAVTKGGVPVDLIVRSDAYESMYDDALSHADAVMDVPVRVVAPDYMVALKLAAARPKDIEDLRFLLTQSVDVDFDNARAIVLDNLGAYAADDLDRYHEEFEWLDEREERAKPKSKSRRKRR
jgi:hypothetical protein